ncbi:MAG: hypothetical protein A2445_02730 [Candidatus Jacksonbacteria bacterium RIFOXYC2_FULL_44_29]|nr:MAG: ADP-ribose pyrophosphatase [Parcubacteria group bacterium GW2011_GWA2_42_28]KKT55916.1 MAG: ADP-ribose pyrophosphatase [Parcubacteria group bacterium GW2011_GWC2_44_22]OGY74528.1 MAG: hypothetical protein A2240_02985 [Candidatus Jacksonbacteria bacterium RIFOXYA2_FULL_43_12]OGY77438.1 MAG: hypothetical protein A2295_01935 [Candidatus Jacksonbacteria bacterium RIFOXYB2_FULL_44_15]OGY78210.1 MAG: hypothetical protein A2550_06280 [Candidatus Jacksonbacteria bacterium RIFOXYD2_FULL_43_21]O
MPQYITKAVIKGLIYQPNWFKPSKFLLVKRSNHESFEPGCWDLPGGGIDAFEQPEEALKREVKEETDLVVKPIKPLVIYSTQGVVDTHIHYVNILYQCHYVSGQITLSKEHDEYCWLTLKQARKLTTTKELAHYLGKI